MRIAGALAFLAAFAFLAAPFLIPVDEYRPLLVWAVEDATGRSVQIDSLKLYVLPNLHISVGNFRMKNPPGFPAGDALTASSVDLGIAPQALLSRRLDITYIAPSDVQVNVLRDVAGRTNFAAPVASRTSTASMSAPVFTLERIDTVNVKDAEITFADSPGSARPAPALSLRGVSGTIGSIDTQAADWAKKLEIVADLRGAQLTTSMLAEPIEFHTGELTIKGGAARSTFSLAVGSIDLTGSAAFARLDPLSITFSVAGAELDLKALGTLLPAAHGSAAGPKTARRLLARGSIEFGRVVFAPLEASQLKGQLELYTGAARLNAWRLSAYGGTARGSTALDGSAGTPIALTAQLRGLNAERTLAALGLGSGSITGTLDANVRLTTLVTRDPVQALKTSGTFAVRNGSFPGTDIKGQLATAARLMSLNVPSGDTHFSYFGGDLSIVRERGYSNELTLLSTGMQATSQGSFGFDQTLQYSGTGILDPLTPQTSSAGSPALALIQPILAGVLQKQIGTTHVRAPFSLRGTFGSPQFALSGAPQLVTAQSSGQPAQQPLLPASVQNLVNFIPGL